MGDIRINCIQCGNEFVFTAGEQERYSRMGFNEPHRCPQCRRHKVNVKNHGDSRLSRDKKKHYRNKYE